MRLKQKKKKNLCPLIILYNLKLNCKPYEIVDCIIGNVTSTYTLVFLVNELMHMTSRAKGMEVTYKKLKT